VRFVDILTVPFDDGGAGAAGIGEIVRATVAFGFVCTVRVAAGFGLAVRVAVGFGSGLIVRVAVGFGFGSGLIVRVAVGFGVGLAVRVTVGFGVGLTVRVTVGLGHAGVLPFAPLEPPDGSPVAMTLQADPQATFAKANLTVRV
jgi:hypothetical protein